MPTILLTNDKEQETALCKILERAGHQVFAATEEEDIISLLSKYRPNLIQQIQQMKRDHTTGLLGKDAFYYLLEQHLALSLRDGSVVSIAIVDVDFFKKVNDTYGHLIGDKVLEEFSQQIQESLRGSDLVFRFGGEEFVVILPNTPPEEAYEAVSRVAQKIRGHSFVEGIELTFSAGIASSKESTCGDKILDLADKALYEAKRGGRNRIHLGRGKNYESA